MDIAVPIVFPDYLIAVPTPRHRVNLPGDHFDFTIPATHNRVPELGHAGVLFVRGANGLSKYYEYGRYDSAGRGLVRRLAIPDAAARDGRVGHAALEPLLRRISTESGQGGRIEGVFIERANTFEAMLSYAEARRRENTNASRQPYTLTGNNCAHFVRQVLDAAGIPTPWIVDPRPNSFIGEFRDDYPDLDYSQRGGVRIGS